MDGLSVLKKQAIRDRVDFLSSTEENLFKADRFMRKPCQGSLVILFNCAIMPLVQNNKDTFG